MRKPLFVLRKRSRLFLGVVVFLFLMSFFVAQQTVHAVAGVVSDPTHLFATQHQTALDEKERVKKEVKKTAAAQVVDALMGGLFGAFNTFLQTLAFDVGEYIGNGGQGKTPMFISNTDKYFKDIALDSAADAIGELGAPWGINLCEIPDIRINIALKVGLSLQAARPQVKCNWKKLKATYGKEGQKEWRKRYGTDKGLAERFVTDLDITQEPIGIAGGASAKIGGLQVNAKINSQLQYLAGGGFKDVKDFIKGDTRTPAQMVAEAAKVNGPKMEAEITAGQIAGMYGTASLGMLRNAVSMLIRSAASTGLKNLMDSLAPKPEDEEVQFVYLDNLGGDSEFADIGAEVSALDIGAQKRFERFEPSVPLSDYDIIAQEYAVCPDTGRGVNNCVVDSRMLELLAKASIETITIKQAIDTGLLPNHQLISSRHQIHADREACWKGNYYCESNIAKLKKLRIFPLGFEIAAATADPDNPPTLKQVVDGYTDCPVPGASPDEVAQKPYCHLINPNWVIKTPLVKCQGKFFGQQAVSNDIADRIEECIDVQTCIDKDEFGNCIYGYCTKEKNTWDIDADSCPEQFATCKTYRNNENRSSASYLSRSVEYGECSADSVGCRVYALEKVNDEWTTTLSRTLEQGLSFGRMPALHINKKAKDLAVGCGDANNGCTAFIPALRHTNGDYVKTEEDGGDGDFVQDTRGGGELTHIKKAPDYLGCYDTITDTLPIDRPTTIQQARNAVSQNEACNDFSAVCVEEEVGCQQFFPVSFNGLPIPGKIGPQNLCNEECVGYDTFKQVDYKELGQGFDDEVFPLHFIPRIAQENMRADGLGCVAEYAGCDEFTNLEDVSVGGGQLEHYVTLKYCEKPQAGGTNELTLFSWEGSAAEGFVLQTHLVRPMSEQDVDYITAIFERPEDATTISAYPLGSPRYADDRPSVLRELAKKCDADTYQIKLDDPNDEGAAPADCHELFDEQNTKHYRLLSQLITVSDQCHELRKTVANTYLHIGLEDQICTQRGGKPEGNDCTRCVAGGKFDAQGTCIYSAMTGENESRACPANANKCRAYTGNTAANVERIISDVFEPAGSEQEDLNAARNGWGYTYPAVDQNNATIAAQSADIGLNSLRLSGNQQFMRHIATTTARFDDNATYEMTFWAQTALAQDITFALHQMNEDNNDVGGELGAFDAVQIGATWQRYQVGPITLTNANPEVDVYLVLQKAGAGDVFIDNVELTRVQDHIYLIEDSWKTRPEQYDVPIACDSVPADALPGEALGCKAYAEGAENGPVRFATGFDMLCREKAIGCQPLWDTFNTLEGENPELMHVYNAQCNGDSNPLCSITVTVNDEDEQYDCNIPNGQDFCYIPGPIIVEDLGDITNNPTNSAVLVKSTVVIPADTATSTPLFLGVTDSSSCNEADRGCMEVGLEKQTLPPGAAISTIESRSVYVKNDPSEYNSILCLDSLVGCSEFSYSGGISYFKDPNIVGSAICAYRDAAPTSVEPHGWFIADTSVGICSGGDLDSPQYCKEDADCAGTCEQVGNAPCYPDKLNRDGAYGLVSNASNEYRSLVGSCPAQFNMCTELLDPQDTSQIHPKGKPYFVLFNPRLTSRFGECNGKVNLLEGCVLLDNVEEPNKLFSAADTYAASEATSPVPFGTVVPRVRPIAAENDTNLLLKVKRDRVCSEFLGCRTTQPVRTSDGTQRDVCYQFQACDERSTDPNATCASWVTDQTSVQDANDALGELTKKRYVREKDTSWYGEEYSGYSLYNTYQITNMVYRYFNIEKIKEGCSNSCDEFDQFKGTMFIVRKYPEHRLLDEGDGENGPCVNEDNKPANFESCGIGGFCYDLECLSPITGELQTELSGDTTTHAQKISLLKELQGDECKAYPEIDSPFSYGVLTVANEQGGIDDDGAIVGSGDKNRRKISNNTRRITSIGGLYGAVNVCQNGSCGCAYKKVTFAASAVDYYPLQKREQGSGIDDSVPGGICISENSKKGKPCGINSDCSAAEQSGGNGPEVGGVCQKKTKEDTKYGLRGFCLQYDRGVLAEIPGEDFPCLMWLPIEVSASRVDELNSYVESGYYPTEDAEVPEAGKLYCMEAGLAQNAGVIDQETQEMVSGDGLKFYFLETKFSRANGPFSPNTLSQEIDKLKNIFPGEAQQRVLANITPENLYQSFFHSEDGSPDLYMDMQKTGTEMTMGDRTGDEYYNANWDWLERANDKGDMWRKRTCINLFGKRTFYNNSGAESTWSNKNNFSGGLRYNHKLLDGQNNDRDEFFKYSEGAGPSHPRMLGVGDWTDFSMPDWAENEAFWNYKDFAYIYDSNVEEMFLSEIDIGDHYAHGYTADGDVHVHRYLKPDNYEYKINATDYTKILCRLTGDQDGEDMGDYRCRGNYYQQAQGSGDDLDSSDRRKYGAGIMIYGQNDGTDERAGTRAMLMGDWAHLLCPEFAPRQILGRYAYDSQPHYIEMARETKTFDRAKQIGMVATSYFLENKATGETKEKFVLMRSEGPGAEKDQFQNWSHHTGVNYAGSREVNGTHDYTGQARGDVMISHLLSVPSASDAKTWGPLQYAPSEFVRDRSIHGSENPSNNSSLSTFSVPGRDTSHGERRTAYLSAGPRLYPFDIANQSERNRMLNSPGNRTIAGDRNPVYRSLSELMVKEGDLSKVHFFVTKIVDGLDKQTLPTLGHNGLTLPLNELRYMKNTDTVPLINNNTMISAHHCGGLSVDNIAPGGNEEFPMVAGEEQEYDNHGSCVGDDDDRYRAPNEVHVSYSLVDSGDISLQKRDDYNKDNTPYSRYVLVWNNNELGMQDDGVYEDPFARNACGNGGTASYGDDTDGTNWFAIGLDFNTYGDFLGYVSVNCNKDRFAAYPLLSIVGELNDICVDTVSVYDDSATIGAEGLLDSWTNKAWTSRVFTDNGNLPLKPSGSILQDTSGVASISSDIIKCASSGEGDGCTSIKEAEDVGRLRNQAFEDIDGELLELPEDEITDSDGVPFDTTHIYHPFSLGSSAVIRRTPYGSYLSDYVESMNGSRSVYDYFAKTYSRFAFQDGRDIGWLRTEYTSIRREVPVIYTNFVKDSRKLTDDTSSEPDVERQAPHIFSTNPVTCARTDAEGERSAGEQTRCGLGEKDNVTISGKTGIPGVDYDRGPAFYEQDSKSIINKKSFYAVMEFFYAADDNHMPVRRIMVDWDDSVSAADITNEDRWGMYRNRKPVCNDGHNKRCVVGEEGPQLTELMTCKHVNDCPVGVGLDAQDSTHPYACGHPGKRFGDQERACDEGPMRFTHEYTCSRSDILVDKDYVMSVSAVQSLDQDAYIKLIIMNLTNNDEVCVFKPKVQVLDNWEWCNGVDGDGEYEGKYGSGRVGDADDCASNNENAFTPYKGYIIVIPPLNEEE
ncbi:MAG: hypothetical protein HOJ25_01440 [Candidatus Magasanikbacteria bacterium]|nr:hypothetical protein [Candidatus Magasanikbacteria bacterium]